MVTATRTGAGGRAASGCAQARYGSNSFRVPSSVHLTGPPLWLLRRGVRQGMKGRDLDGTVLIREAVHEDAPQIAELLSELGYPLSASEAGVRLARGSETAFVAAEGPSQAGRLASWR